MAKTNNTNLVLGLVLGPVLGAVFGAVLTFAFFFKIVDSMSTSGAVTLAIVLPFLLPIPLLFFKQTRPWGFGLVMGVTLGQVPNWTLTLAVSFCHSSLLHSSSGAAY